MKKIWKSFNIWDVIGKSFVSCFLSHSVELQWYLGIKNVLRRRPKTEVLLEGSRKRLGSEFHVERPATANARPPYVTRRCGGTVSWWLAAERRCCRDTVSETGAQCDVRYCRAVPSWHCRAVPSWHRRIIMQSFYLTHLGTSSRWRSACNSCVASQTAMLTFNVAVSSELYWFWFLFCCSFILFWFSARYSVWLTLMHYGATGDSEQPIVADEF